MVVKYKSTKHELNNCHEYYHMINNKLYAHSSYEGCVMYNSKGKKMARLRYMPN